MPSSLGKGQACGNYRACVQSCSSVVYLTCQTFLQQCSYCELHIHGAQKYLEVSTAADMAARR